MAQSLMNQAIKAAKQALLLNKGSVSLFGIVFSLVHAHDNEWQFLAPSGDEIFRLIRKSKACVEVLLV